MGHDHTRWNERVANASGDSVLVIDPANTAKVVSEVTVTVKKQNGKIVSKQVDGKLVSMDEYAVDKDFMHTFQKQYEATQAFVSRKSDGWNVRFLLRMRSLARQPLLI